MFFEVEMRRLVVVEPRELGDALHTKRAMIRRLIQDVDAEQCSEQHGYYVTVTTLEDVSEGKVRGGTGSVVFWVDFKCIVLRLIRNEVMEAEVAEVMYNGFLAACGPAKIFVPRKQMDGFEFRAGPSLEFNQWSDSNGLLITPKCFVRLKIVAVRWEPKGRILQTVGSLNGDLLGPVKIQKNPVL
ncbi:hypothetical protein KC19_11G137100 [Ceratodon purpureus]|uniref:Uncharacterized protein n=1 Tax=Ceratodon purpureus TaxID=3225 RepID=A0A8T0GEQ3_CERPU|nr:hypothetical protein KC19_11G137100 [Ceratodon purpureus]